MLSTFGIIYTTVGVFPQYFSDVMPIVAQITPKHFLQHWPQESKLFFSCHRCYGKISFSMSLAILSVSLIYLGKARP